VSMITDSNSEGEERMDSVQDPRVQRRRLSLELRRARDAVKFKQAEVAQAMDWSSSKLVRIERGDVNVSTNDLRALLDHYGVKDEMKVEELLELARSARGTSFYDQFSELLKPGFKEYLAYESSASVIRQYDPVIVPGLLQTEEYARGLFWGHRFDPDRADRLWTLRQYRQLVHDRRQPPDMNFVLDEAALRRHVGRGHAMLHQLEQLKEMAERPYITIRIIPFTRGAHPGLDGNFIILEFDDPNLTDLVHLESSNQITIRDDTEQIARSLDKFELLQEIALSPNKSKEFLAQLIVDMRASAQSKNSAPKEAV
jgi:transcriptional regulator with XRE-family HTH domain